MRVHVLGGFLGAGKTTAVRALASVLADRGERVAIITNDQGHSLVDTEAVRDVTETPFEIGGGCFCCRYDQLEDGLEAARAGGATVALCEAVGSCTDLVATVLSPLANRQAGRVSVAPLAVLVDPYRALDAASGALPADVVYLFEKQIEEADLVVVTRADLDAPDISGYLSTLTSAPVISASGVTGQGLSEWLSTQPLSLASPLNIDYDRYAAAEALLGWANGTVSITGPLEPRAVVKRFFAHLEALPVAHLKVRVTAPAVGWANWVRHGEAARFALDALPKGADHMALIVNARMAMPPAELRPRLLAAMAGAAPGAVVIWDQLACFEPGRPVPTHRYATRCDPEGDAACCAAFYQRPDIRYLLGDSYHPGGQKLTLELGQQLGLNPGSEVLDVACGLGTSLRTLRAAYGASGVGVDVAVGGAKPAEGLQFVAGDVHALPFDDGRFGSVLCECALSTFTDQPLALAELFRVLAPGGVLAVSDMVANGPIPDELRDWIHIGTCLSHARTLEQYGDLLHAAGFEVTVVHDSAWALTELIRTIKRRLLGAAMARATGLLSADVDLDTRKGRQICGQASALVNAGTVSYGYLIARKPW